MTTGILSLLGIVGGIILWFLRRKRGRIDPKVDVAEKITSKARANVQKMRSHLAKGETDELENDLDRQERRLDSLRGVLKDGPNPPGGGEGD